MLLHFKKLGEGEPLFIIHGVFGMLDNWMSLGKIWAEDYAVYLIDARNHGKSGHSEEMNYQVMAEDIEELRMHLDLDEISLLGHSMGGKIAMKYAILFPDNLKKLIVVDIGPKDYTSGHDDLLEALIELDLDSFSSRSEVESALSESIVEAGIRLFLLKNLYWKEKGVLDFRMNLKVIKNNMDNIVESIGYDRVTAPTLFLRGLESKYIQDDDLTAIHMQFTSSEVLDVENAGHWIHAQQPEAVLHMVSAFLAR